MAATLSMFDESFKPVSKYEEVSAYEALWDKQGSSFKHLSELFKQHPNCLPSELVSENTRKEYKALFSQIINKYKLSSFGIAIYSVDDYPEKLRDAKYPVELLYYQGNWDLVGSKCISVVGTRNPSEEGIKRTKKLVKYLVENDFTIVSGLAKGIDTVAHKTAIELGGRTIAVIGTPLSHQYPKENATLQSKIASDHLLISQVPFCHYEHQDFKMNRFFFPERNVTMSALSVGTIIVEAGETSGTLIQARAALAQNRKLFILDNCFQNKELSWPKKFEDKGAVRVKDFSDLEAALNG